MSHICHSIIPNDESRYDSQSQNTVVRVFKLKSLIEESLGVSLNVRFDTSYDVASIVRTVMF